MIDRKGNPNFEWARKMIFAVLLIVSLLQFQVSSAQSRESRLEIYFRQNVHQIEADAGNNAKSLDQLSSLLDYIVTDTLSSFSKIEINSWTSPEPGVAYNKVLSQRRSNSIKKYILERWDLPDSMLVAVGNGIAWDKLRYLVAESDMEHRAEVLHILDNVPVETWERVKPTDKWMTLVDSREKHLMDLYGGRPYRYLYDSLYPQLRFGSQVTFLFSKMRPIALEKEQLPCYAIEMPQLEMQKCAPEYVPVFIPEPERERVPLLALKTNLLFDVATILNVEVEVPIFDKFSALAEWNFPWWVARDNGSALEVLSGSLEGRYWFGDRTDVPKLTGWFGGLYAGGGLYDVQWNDNGYQGEFFIAAGVSAGYAHTINKSETLRLEYSLGVGYLETDYRYYEGRQDNKYLVWQYDGSYSWFGPTKAKVSLVWMLHRWKGGRR